ncbi:FadR family transcriptional regulator [Leucobacter sp. cx-328]|uniref:FadR/GntR family transcriptional regulator n=1 Tax=unclassified Leucobacter TaxID=2621730 RepID=UPI00165DA47A|nr:MULTISPECIES: FCD domain-containing protein [unclassified Leucobacter]MBC9943195.1 FadR family transcriptional regulator [Leucobacter sp. cx-328]
MAQVTRVSLADQAAELLLERIRSGEWEIGAKLPSEMTLVPELGVGRSTVREAIRQLAGRGILTSRQGAGVFVTAFEASEDLSDVLRRADIAAVLEARIAIETEAAALAAARRTGADLDDLRAALAERERDFPDVVSLVAADTAFHRAVIVASHNPVLVELFDSFAPRLRDAMVEMLELPRAGGVGSADRGHEIEPDNEAHEALIKAIIERDAQTAARESRSHLEELKVRL